MRRHISLNVLLSSFQISLPKPLNDALHLVVCFQVSVPFENLNLFFQSTDDTVFIFQNLGLRDEDKILFIQLGYLDPHVEFLPHENIPLVFKNFKLLLYRFQSISNQPQLIILGFEFLHQVPVLCYYLLAFHFIRVLFCISTLYYFDGYSQGILNVGQFIF